jgi:drug/metabolite transporter (DMT)-like permease
MVAFSISPLFIPRLSRRLSTLTINVYSTLAGMTLMLPLVAGEGAHSKLVINDQPIMWLLLAAAGLMSLFAGWLWTYGVAVVGAGTASLFNNLPPFIALLAGYLLLGDPIEAAQLLGGMIILAGVFLSNYPGVHKTVADAESSG